MAHPDFVIAGAGIIGISLALELDRQGAKVTVVEQAHALSQTSAAAAGMLAADDPLNPPSLAPLAHYSVGLYPAWLDWLEELSGERVPFQTTSTFEACAENDPARLANPQALVPMLADDAPALRLLAERSVDPRQLANTLRIACARSGVELREQTRLERVAIDGAGVRVQAGGTTLTGAALVDCMGTWSPAPVKPMKGQMLAVELAAGQELDCVVRTDAVYMVPRTEGPDRGRVVIGATIEDAGFDLEVMPRSILALNAAATRLLPALGSAVLLETWAGLRPATRDGLPLLGATARQPRYVLATGHFRNGILLAPGTARALADVLLGRDAEVDLAAYRPGRFDETHDATATSNCM